jgi:DNA-binding NarL/FixJ family response regulator
MQYKAAIIDDHPLILESLKAILESTALFESVKSFQSAEAFDKETGANLADLYLVDISLGSEDGKELIKKIRKKQSQCRILAVSSHDNPRIIKASLKAGADSYLLKSSGVALIVDCVQKLVNDEDFIPKDVQKILNNYLRNQNTFSRTQFPELTEREMEILQLIAEEYTSKEIAEKLFISEHTVENHRANLFHKYDAKNLAGLIRKAIRSGVID